MKNQIQLNIKNLIHVIRNRQVILDSDLAMLYQVETKRLNEAVKRNIERFPEGFRFQLTEDEAFSLRSQFATSKGNSKELQRGGRRYFPYVFTEQGIAMLSAVLRSDVAIDVSINIMEAFVKMRHFIANNALLFEHISNVELKQLEYQKNTDEKLGQVFEYISNHEESSQKIFFDGQIYDAFSFIVGLIQKAHTTITLIDGYVDIETLNILSKKNANVSATVYTQRSQRLSPADIKKFNAQYPILAVKNTNAFHDRYLIIDYTIAYHIGASLKDAGKKCFSINQIQDEDVIQGILKRLD